MEAFVVCPCAGRGRVWGKNRVDLGARSQGQAIGRAQSYARWHGEEPRGLVHRVAELAKTRQARGAYQV